MLIAGGLLAFLTLGVPHSSSVSEVPVIVAGAIALALGAGFVARPEMAPGWVTPGIVAFGTVLITLDMRLVGVDGGPGGDNEILYLMVVMYSFYFLTTGEAYAQLALIGLAYGWLLLEAIPPDVALFRWGVTLGTLTVAGQLVRSLEGRVEQLVGELDASARRDPLTGTLNRRGLDERLGIEIARARRTREPITVLTADLDQLKAINDAHGHRAGDEALELVADVMAASLRDVDVLARTGGDEFVMLLPGCEPAKGFEIAEQLRKGARERSAAESWPATLSIGVAGAPPMPLDPQGLLAAADRALYRAKQLGRDRTSLAGRAEVRRALELD